MRMLRSPFTVALLSVALICILLTAGGCFAFGGGNGFVRRIRGELINAVPHDSLVPTPLAVTQPQDHTNEDALNSTLVTADSTFTHEIVSETVEFLPTATPLSASLPEESVNTQQVLIASSHQLPLPAVELDGFRHEWQTWNNCGPATLSFYLSYYGSWLTQADTGSQLRHHPDDKNVDPFELAAFAQAQGYAATVRVNGSRDLMRTFLSNGIPVLIETWLEEEPNDGMGHYRLLTGYDDAGGYWIAHDSYVTRDLLNPSGSYRGIRLYYGETDALWKVFNRTYLVVYPPANAELVSSIFGADLANAYGSELSALAQAKGEIAVNPADAFAWFNLGSTLTRLSHPAEAASAFDEALRMGLPWRMLWYQFEPFAAYYQMGRYREVVALADATMRNATTIEELYYWKGMALARLNDPKGATELWQQALALNSGFLPARQALAAQKQ